MPHNLNYGLRWALLTAAVVSSASAQTTDMQRVLERLDRLESQNQELMAEIRALRQQLAAPAQPAANASTSDVPPPADARQPDAAKLEERVEVHQQQIGQLDQEKISSEHRLPLTLTGMLLFNTFWTGRGAGGSDNPTTAASPSTALLASGGATFRQSVVGVKFDGPRIIGGGKVTGSAFIDFFGGTGGTLNQMLRLRVASIDASWKNTTVSFALDKPVIAPREPDSLAQVGVSPLTGSGNLWLWQPQVRLEQRFALGRQAGLRAQVGIYQTNEGSSGVPAEYAGSVAKSRPGYEGRFELWAAQGESRRIEIAPGFHASSTRVIGLSVPSRIFTMDWLIRPVSRVDFTGAFFQGENVGVVGGLRQGVGVFGGTAHSVHSVGGWAQVKVQATSRLAFHFYGGIENDRGSDLQSGAIARNQAYAANIVYRFGSNILASFEDSRVRTGYLNSITRMFPHYDVALAYLF